MNRTTKSIKLSERSVGWLLSDIQEWVEKRISVSRDEQEVSLKGSLIDLDSFNTPLKNVGLQKS